MPTGDLTLQIVEEGEAPSSPAIQLWEEYNQLIAEGRHEEALTEARRVAPMSPQGPASYRDWYIEHMVRNNIEQAKHEEARRAPNARSDQRNDHPQNSTD